MIHAILFTPGNVDAATRTKMQDALAARWHFFGARQTLTRAQLGATSQDRIVLCGWSAGGHAVRDCIASLALAERDAVVVADGVHIREEPGSSMPRAPWQAAIDRARVGEGPRMLISHTYLTYTDTMRDDPRTPAVERPYQSTATSLRTLTGWALEEPTIANTSTRKAEGGLTVISHESDVYDAVEHAEHLNIELPAMLREVRDTMIADGDIVAQVVEPSDPTWRDPSLTLAQRMVAWIGAQLYLAPKELPGTKHEPRIVAYGEHCRRGGIWRGTVAGWTADAKRVSSATDEEAWCAKLQSAALVACWLPGDAVPFSPRVAVAELYRDAVEAGTWQAAGHALPLGVGPAPGDLMILARAGGDPTKGGTGHVRMCVSVDGDRYRGVGGNETNTIVDVWHLLTDRDLRGWIRAGRGKLQRGRSVERCPDPLRSAHLRELRRFLPVC